MPKPSAKISPAIPDLEKSARKTTPKAAPQKREGRTAVPKPSRATAVERESPAAPSSRAKTALPKTMPATPTNEEIALCAYYISQEKRSLGLHSDPTKDWLEAESRLASDRNGGNRARSSEKRAE